MKCEETFYAQKSVTNWIRLGDENTRYFHARMKERHASARISCLLDEEGRPVTEQDHIKDQFINYFSDIFSADFDTFYEANPDVIQVGSVLSGDQINLLDQDINLDDIQRALFSMAPDKALGPDVSF